MRNMLASMVLLTWPVVASADPQPSATSVVAPRTAEAAPNSASATAPLTPSPALAATSTYNSSGEAQLSVGSYGRVMFGTDLKGGRPLAVNIVARGPRIIEPSYLELQTLWRQPLANGWVKPVFTLAFGDALFHDTGTFATSTAIRNLFVEFGRPIAGAEYRMWAGSRMYRGDDIYVFDEWPVDNQNTVGAGLERSCRGARLAAHAGYSRLLTPFQYQEVTVANPAHGAATVTQLNRQRLVTSATAEARVWQNTATGLAIKLKGHLEYMQLPAGERERDDRSVEILPTDRGLRAGVQATLWQAADAAHPARYRNLSVFARYGRGLAAYSDLAVPNNFDANKRTFPRATELALGAWGGWDAPWGNVLFGAKARRFVDADVNVRDSDDGWEYVADVRPLVHLGGGAYAGMDISYQVRFPEGLNPITLQASDPAVTQLAPMLVYSPVGNSAFARPQVRLVYRAAHLTSGARDLFVPEDPRHTRTWQHYLGVQAEWTYQMGIGN